MRPSKSIVIRSPSLQPRATSVQFGPLLAQALDHRVDVRHPTTAAVGRVELDAAHVLQFDLRVDLEGRGVAQVVGLAGLLRLDARTAGGLQLLLAQRLRKGFADEVGNDLFAHLRP